MSRPAGGTLLHVSVFSSMHVMGMGMDRSKHYTERSVMQM